MEFVLCYLLFLGLCVAVVLGLRAATRARRFMRDQEIAVRQIREEIRIAAEDRWPYSEDREKPLSEAYRSAPQHTVTEFSSLLRSIDQRLARLESGDPATICQERNGADGVADVSGAYRAQDVTTHLSAGGQE